MLAIPILVERKYLMGVLLLINKRSGDRFTPEEEVFAADIAETLGMALRNQSQLVQRRPTKFDHLLEQRASYDRSFGEIARAPWIGVGPSRVLHPEGFE